MYAKLPPLVQENTKEDLSTQSTVENSLLWFSGSKLALLLLIFSTFVVKIFETIIHRVRVNSVTIKSK